MRQISYTNAAVSDLEDIYNFSVTSWDEGRAISYIADLTTSIGRLSDFPEMGPIRNPRIIGIRQLKHASHVIVYRIHDAATIRILRVVHARRLLTDDELDQLD